MELLYWFTLEIQGGPLAQGNEMARDKIAEASPDVAFSRFQGKEFARYSRTSDSLQAATLQAMREIREFLPETQLVSITERSPASPVARA